MRYRPIDHIDLPVMSIVIDGFRGRVHLGWATAGADPAG